MIRSQRKQERGVGLMALQLPHQIGDAFAGAAVSVGVDFEDE